MTAEPREAFTPEALLLMVFDRPHEAMTAAQQVLASQPDPVAASGAHQAVGLVHREFGDLPLAIRHLRTAVRLARSAGSRAREADALATLGHALVHAGRSAAGIATLDEALRLASGVEKARIRYRRGATFEVLGRHEEALSDLRLAIKALRDAGDDIWTARALTFRGLISLAGGHIDRADRDFRSAEEIHGRTGQRHEYAVARWNRGLVAYRAGDLPAALELLDDADQRCRAAGVMPPDLVADRCSVRLAAGLAPEALAAADHAVADLVERRGMATRRAELLFVAARAAYASGDHAGAIARATAAADAFRRQDRPWWREHANLLSLQARFRASGASPRLGMKALGAAERLRAVGSPECVQADLLAGRIAIAVGRLDDAGAHLGRAALARHGGPAVSRVTGWLARALLAEAEGRQADMLAACRRGLAVLDDYRLTLGATELRARVTAQGAELAELAQRAAARTGTARQVLLWSERWRATASSVPPVQPAEGEASFVELVALRDVTARIDQARRNGEPFAALARDRARLEARVRDSALRTPARLGVDRLPAGLALRDLLDELGGARLLEIVEIDGDLHVLVCGSGRVRRVVAGRAATAAKLVEQARFLLRSAAHADPDRAGALAARMSSLGVRLEAELLGSASTDLADEHVVVVPPGRLHHTPWALLPALADRAHAAAPSARAWLSARRTAPPRSPSVVLVRGPELGSGEAEIDAIARIRPEATVLRSGTATVGAVIDALESSSLAHIAAHGEFRADSPLLSSLQMDDGPLTVYDLERLRRAPHRIVLPCCDSARLQPVGADELLGLATALLPLGTAGIVAGVIPLNDLAAVPVMVTLHEGLAAGETMAEALLRARRAAVGDRGRSATASATASALVAFGAA
ncbi:CHAT domain-containing protein [Pseudonocardia sp. CA-107938]|uniref:CHAT domain-containing protein n=1 Tax=Pseudonocardia sp. CA-107938 TaxID=3240021 RepID=UPI003D8F5CD0